MTRLTAPVSHREEDGTTSSASKGAWHGGKVPLPCSGPPGNLRPLLGAHYIKQHKTSWDVRKVTQLKATEAAWCPQPHYIDFCMCCTTVSPHLVEADLIGAESDPHNRCSKG